MLNNQVKFNVAIISNVHTYQFFLFLGGGGKGGCWSNLLYLLFIFFSLGGGELGVKE